MQLTAELQGAMQASVKFPAATQRGETGRTCI